MWLLILFLIAYSTSLALITPFYSASLVETVQSDIASEKPGIFDVFKEGMRRLVRWGSPHKGAQIRLSKLVVYFAQLCADFYGSWRVFSFTGRMLPVWSLVVPTVMYGLFKYVFSSIVRVIARRFMRDKRKREQQKKVCSIGALSSCTIVTLLPGVWALLFLSNSTQIANGQSHGIPLFMTQAALSQKTFTFYSTKKCWNRFFWSPKAVFYDLAGYKVQ